jgi:hypothetical protein
MTSKQKTIKWITLCFAFFFLATGCAHEMRRFPAGEELPPPLPQYDPAPHLLQQPEGLEQRIEAIRTILKSPQLSLEDRLLAQDLLRTYQAFERTSLRLPDEEHQEFIRLLLSNLIQLDERYFEGLSPKETEGVRAMTLFSEKRRKLMDSYLIGDYDGVIERAVDIENTFGPDSLTPQIGLVLAVSLAKRGMVQEALGVGTRISDDLERMPGVMELRAKMVEWQLTLGDRKGAVRSYEKLVDSIHETEAFLKGAERKMSEQGQRSVYDKKKEAYPGSVDFTREPPSLQEVLGQVEVLVQKNDFDAAKLLLLRFAIRLQGGAEADLVDQAMRSVEIAEQKAWEQERVDAFQKKEALEIAAGLIEQEKYEEAIAQIDSAKWGKELGPEAKQLQNMAEEKIINRQRNEAAKLFLMARNTQDPTKKEGLLVDSHNILKNLLDKYPLTPLKQTINDNIRRIEEELSKVKKGAG